jgi:hypothetical protein
MVPLHFTLLVREARGPAAGARPQGRVVGAPRFPLHKCHEDGVYPVHEAVFSWLPAPGLGGSSPMRMAAAFMSCRAVHRHFISVAVLRRCRRRSW